MNHLNARELEEKSVNERIMQVWQWSCLVADSADNSVDTVALFLNMQHTGYHGDIKCKMYTQDLCEVYLLHATVTKA